MGTYRKLLRYLSGLKKEVAFKVLLGLLTSATYIAQAILMADVVNLVRAHEEPRAILWRIGVVLALILVRGLMIRETEAYTKVLAARVKSKLRLTIVDQVYRLGPGYFGAKRSGKVTSLILDGIEALEPFYVSFIPQVITVLVTGIFVFVYLCTFDVVSSLILLLSMVLCVVVPLVMVPLIQKTLTSYWTGYSALTSQYIDAIQGMTTLKTLNAEQREKEELREEATSFFKKTIRNTGISLISSSIMLVLMAVTSSLTVVVCALRVNAGLVPAAAVTAFLFLAVECARPMADLDRHWHNSFLGLSVAKELFELLEREPDVPAKENGDRSSLSAGCPSVRLDHVSFTYPTGTKAVRGVSLRVPPGGTVALVGHSGSGKSTILNLLLRFYDVEQGAIRYNSVDIRDYDLEYLLSNIAVVFQDSFLFFGTIADNIRMARPEASDEEVEQAAKAANIHDFIMSLPDGYKTIVGERGMTLSGGERQRVSIARAILKDAPVLLLDEATSSVDAVSESLIQSALAGLMKNRTTIIVAHRLSTIQNADQIFVLEDGQLAETGTHEELLSRGGVYYSLVMAQEVSDA